MGYKLESIPKIVYWLETKQFTIKDDSGKSHEIRVGESSKNVEYFIWKDPGGWDEINDHELAEWINEDLSEQEWELEETKDKNTEIEMDKIIEEYKKESGEIKGLKELEDVVSQIIRSGILNHKKDHYERFYTAFYYVKRKMI